MNDKPEDPRAQALEAALEVALQREFSAPGLPAGFRERLRAAIVRAAQVDHAALRRELEREERATLRALQEGYVRVRRQALVTMLLAAFVAGAAAIFAMPLLVAGFGSQAPLVLAGGVGALAVVAGIGYALRGAWQALGERLLRWLP